MGEKTPNNSETPRFFSKIPAFSWGQQDYELLVEDGMGSRQSRHDPESLMETEESD